MPIIFYKGSQNLDCHLLFIIKEQNPLQIFSKYSKCPQELALKVPSTCVILYINKAHIRALRELLKHLILPGWAFAAECLLFCPQKMRIRLTDCFFSVTTMTYRKWHCNWVQDFNPPVPLHLGSPQSSKCTRCNSCTAQLSAILGGTLYFDGISGISCNMIHTFTNWSPIGAIGWGK